MLIDSHCHLDYAHETKSTDDLVKEAKSAGVDRLITIGTEMSNLDAVAQISERFDNVFHTVGVHPHEAKDIEDSHLPEILKRSQHPKCVAIGETGLDYHYDHSPRDIQCKRLEQQLDVALQAKKPVVIHSRDAEPDLLPLLQNYAKKQTAQKGVIHCFTGTQSFGKACIDLGFYISFSGIVTFKKSEDLRESAVAFPIENLLVETDSPYLAPVPHRGKPCEPWMVKLTAEKLAELKSIPFEDLARTTTANCEKLFSL